MNTSQTARSTSARAFVHSLNILIKYARMYGYDHKRTEAQFETTWNELQTALPSGGDAGFLLGVSDNKLLISAATSLTKCCTITASDEPIAGRSAPIAGCLPARSAASIFPPL